MQKIDGLDLPLQLVSNKDPLFYVGGLMMKISSVQFLGQKKAPIACADRGVCYLVITSWWHKSGKPAQNRIGASSG